MFSDASAWMRKPCTVSQTREGGTEAGTGFAVDPPVAARCWPVALVALGLHVLPHVLVHGRVAVAHLGFREAVEVDDHDTPGTIH